jgi:hypothetical protein
MTAPNGLETRIQNLEDIEEIRNLVETYFDCIDRGYDLATLANVLEEDFEWRSSIGPPLRSRDAFVAAQTEVSGVVAWAFHLFTPVRVDLSAKPGAAARWNTLGLHTMNPSAGSHPPEAVLYTASYDARFRKSGGRWRIATMDIDFKQLSRWTRGWVEEPFFDFLGKG